MNTGSSGVPAKKCAGVAPLPNGMMVAWLVPVREVETKGTTTPKSMRLVTP